jgi:hypothetical protein
MNAFTNDEPSSEFECTLKPEGKLSLHGPVFFAGALQRRRDWLLLSDCLLIRTIEFLLTS